MKRFVIFLSLLILPSCMPLAPSSPSLPQPVPANKNQNQNNASLSLLKVTIATSEKLLTVMAEAARTPQERAYGLMFRTSLPDNHGMLFIFDREERVSFWMKDTLIPLDMIFIDADKKIIHIEKNAPPCKNDPCPVYPSTLPAKYVLEVNGGWGEKNGVMVGDRLKF